jgi:hypothetical protein
MDRSAPGGPTGRTGSGPRVIVSGMVAGVPRQGGAAWAILQYLLGLRRIGCDVLLFEPVDLAGQTADQSVSYCGEVMERFGLGGRWSLVAPRGGATAGMTRSQVLRGAEDADLLINVSGMLTDQEILDRVAVRVYLDLDPAFVQLWHADGLNMHLDSHTHFATIADAIGDPKCPIPTCGRSWIPTLPPVVLEEWPPATQLDHDGFTTVAHWRGYGSIHHEGVHYGQKVHSWRSIIGLPEMTSERFEAALEIDPGEQSDLRALRHHGWQLLDPLAVAGTPDDYWRFVQGSRAELGVAKSGYAVSQSGWFSDRSACYLASGRPVIAQDTGFGRRLPTGQGLFSFVGVGDVLGAIDELRQDYPSHRKAAREVAEEHLDSDRVLSSLVDRVLG